MRLICSQPSNFYFEWQLLILIQSLRKFEGEVQLDIILIGNPLSSIDKLSAMFPWLKVYYYSDVIVRRRDYIPNNKIYGYICHWEKYPELKDEYFLFLDADCLLLNIPDIPKNEIHYGCDITEYTTVEKEIDDLLAITITDVPIGLCYYGVGYTKELWQQIYDDAYLIYDLGEGHGNRWICEMRSWFSSLHKLGFKTNAHTELICGDGIKFGKNIYHHIQHLVFDKRKFKNNSPWEFIPSYNNDELSSNIYLKAIDNCKNNLIKLI